MGARGDKHGFLVNLWTIGSIKVPEHLHKCETRKVFLPIRTSLHFSSLLLPFGITNGPINRRHSLYGITQLLELGGTIFVKTICEYCVCSIPPNAPVTGFYVVCHLVIYGNRWKWQRTRDVIICWINKLLTKRSSFQGAAALESF